MAKIDYPKAIKSLELSYDLLSKKPDTLSESDLKTLGEACTLYLKYYEAFVGSTADPRIDTAYSFQKHVLGTEIENLINKFKEAEEAEEKAAKQEKPKEQDASIPPELEALVAEYRQNLALLESEEYKNNSQKSVALQVKIALAHSKIRALALANRNLRIAKGEKFQDLDAVLVSFGSPKSESKIAALATSYKAVQEVAFTNEVFQKLSPETQNKLITQAVELNTVCVTNIVVAVESAALLIDTDDIPPDDQIILPKISSRYIQSVYEAVNTQTQQAATYETQIIENKIVLLKLEGEAKPLKNKDLVAKEQQIQTLQEKNQQLTQEIASLPLPVAVSTEVQQATEKQSQIAKNEVVIQQLEKEAQPLIGKDLEIIQIQIKSLSETNQRLAKKLKNLPHQFEIFENNQLQDYQKFESASQAQLSKDPDLIDRIELANKNITTLYNTLEKNGIKPHIPTPMDDAFLLEQAIRDDLPGELRLHAGYNAEYAAALVNDPKTQDPSLSPQAILLYGKELTPKLFAKINQFVIDHPTSALGTLFKTRKDIFEATKSQLIKIENSPLGKEITVVKTGLAKTFAPVSKLFGKVSDKIGTFSKVLGKVFRVVQDPLGALKSWAGRKAGEQLIRRITQKIGSVVIINAGEVLIKQGIKGGVKTLAKEAITKLAVKGITWAATKIGISVAAESLNAIAPGLGLLVDVAVQAVLWVAEKTVVAAKKVFDDISTSIYGEKVKTRDLVAVPIAGIATGTAAVVGGVIAFFGALGTATVAAAGSAVAITVAGIFIGIFFYITSIAVAPLISTLVQFSGPQKINPSTFGCAAWPTGGQYVLNQGPLGVFSHAKNSLQAVDILASESTGFLAAAPGEVVFSAPLGTYGNAVIVAATTDVGTIQMLYAHMNSVEVSVGQTVQTGDTIGSVGGTGGWEPHIHFEYRNGEYNSCPAGDIPVPEGCFNDCRYKDHLIITNSTTP